MSFDIDGLVRTPGAWLDGSGDESEIVLSSRTRIARNLHGHRFTHHCDSAELGEILRLSMDAAAQTRAFKHGKTAAMGEISTLDREILVERHLVSRDFASESASRGLVFTDDEALGLMVNEEDHLRIQSFASGFGLGDAFRQTASAPSDGG